LTTKIVALVDALGNLIRFVLLPGQSHDLVGVTLIQDVEFDMFLGDKAFDADWLRTERTRRGSGDPSQIEPEAKDRLRLPRLPLEEPRRELLLQPQNIPAHRHPLRENRSELPCYDQSRSPEDRYTINVHTP
jgi:hypothetical protein